MLFPRMYSECTRSPASYEGLAGRREGTQVPYDQCGQMMMVKVHYPMGEHQVLFLLSSELHVLEILYVELCRTSE